MATIRDSRLPELPDLQGLASLPLWEAAFRAALNRAREFEGATAPNPPVGAVGLTEKGEILSVQAHPKAGTAHAEVRVIEEVRSKGELSRLHTLFVSLEPCNHQGRTGPCSEAVIAAGVKRVVIGAADPNPQASGGAERLKAAGIEVQWIDSRSRLGQECARLIAPFSYRIRTGLPWVTVKQAVRVDAAGAGTAGSPSSKETMIPDAGKKTFTRPPSLVLAHALRKRADAILTGSGTVLADRPLFTVRHLADHESRAGSAGSARWLVIMDRRGRVSAADYRPDGFQIRMGHDLENELRFLSEQGVMEVLVEAGPTLTAAIMRSDFWCRHVLIRSGIESDEVHDVYRNY